MSDRLFILESLDERRQASVQHLEAMQQRDKRHKIKTLQLGTLVMLQDARKIEFLG